MKRGLSLRGFLMALVATGVVYVAAIALLITARIAPAAGKLERHSARFLAAHDSISRQLEELNRSIEDVHRLMTTRGGGRSREGVHADPAPITAAVRARLDSLATLRYTGYLEGIPARMRVVLASAAEAESELGMSLLKALDQIKLGRASAAYGALRRADGYRLETQASLQTAQRIGLAAMTDSERRLGAAARFAGRAVVWWLVIGLLLVPVLLMFLKRRVHEPLAELDHALSGIQSGRLGESIAPRRDDEIGRLARKFNDMSAELRARSEDERRRSESLTERLGQLLDESGNAIVLFDGVTLGVARASRGACDQLGCTRDELEGRTPADLMLSEDAGQFLAQLDELRHGGRRSLRLEVRLKRRDGSAFPALVNVQLSSSEPIMFLMVAHDLSDQREAEQLRDALRESQRLESVGRLAGGVAHDFNNLLTAVIGHTDFLAEGMAQNHVLRPDVDGIRDAAGRAASLTRQLLAFARRQVAEPKIVDLNELTRQVDKLLRRLIGEDIELITLLDPSLGATRLDPTHFEQVLVNLAVNARDAMPGGGRLVIRTVNVHLDQRFSRRHPEVQPGRYVLLTVRDSGTGMDADTRSRIFEPFFTTKASDKGTGLGLATVYGLVRQAGGHITVESEPGKGSTFLVYLPMVDRELTPVETAGGQPLNVGGEETILLVEDQPQIRAVVARGLRGQGYQVLVAGNGTEALDLESRFDGPIHLLLTDVVMPLMSGPELARQVDRRRPGTPVLFMSGYAEEVIAERGVSAPGIELIAKPFSMQDLALRVRGMIDEAVPAGTSGGDAVSSREFEQRGLALVS